MVKFTIECTACNFSDQDVTYDGVDLSVTTDDVTLGKTAEIMWAVRKILL